MRETLGSESWLRANEDAVKALLPATWTHVQNLNGLQLGFGLKLLGVNWRSDQEFGAVMVFLERVGLMQRDGLTVRRNPSRVFPTPPPAAW